MAFQVGPFQINFQQNLVAAAGLPVILAPCDWRISEPGINMNEKLDAMQDDLDDLVRFIGEVEDAGDEYVDPFKSSIDHKWI